MADLAGVVQVVCHRGDGLVGGERSCRTNVSIVSNMNTAKGYIPRVRMVGPILKTV